MKKITALLWIVSLSTMAQNAKISEEVRQLDTYGFGAPNPVPILTENPKIFPYFKFEEYDHTSQKKGWKVVKLENEYIEVYVLPEIGGKVWGAIEKSTGNEFLYRNEVVKFRNIAMRGPWTSGGIEFNFGIIGHHPGTATAVDYKTATNEDGSVSCFVGNMDLPSGTYWQVEIKLDKDKAYFETNASWYNGTPLNQSYYNWMTGAAPATNDLEFFIPGNGYLEHDGTWRKWPIDDKDRNLAMYKNNNFGPSKSYHIVGDYKNYFGGYYHDRNVGFGHLSPYEEMPGQKLWLWALSRSGGIWEDLLTDTDGQYIEFQAGRLFNQYFPGAENPVSQANFDPYVMDSWQELWFPIKEIGGMEAASEYGVLNVERSGETATLGINALQGFKEPLQIFVNKKEVFRESLEMQPMQIFTKTFPCKDTDTLDISVGADKLEYTSVSKTLLKRDFVYKPEIKPSRVEQLYHEASEAMKYREYALADEKLTELFALDATHHNALILAAEAEYRKTRYDKALELANTALQLDTYNPEANYLAGIAYWAQKDALNALESFGWAARSIQFRSVSFALMAEIHLYRNELDKAERYAKKALAFNAYNLNARQVLLVVYRKYINADAFKKQLKKVFKISPINHFAAFEEILFQKEASASIIESIQNEFRNETLLELALEYLNLGQGKMAEHLLNLNSKDLKSNLYLAYASKNSEKGKELLSGLASSSPDFVFPYRREMIPVLEWAVSTHDHWKFKYYLAQNYLAVGLNDKAIDLLKQCKDVPDNDTFYSFRAKIMDDDAPYGDTHKDFETSLALNKSNWKRWDDFILFYLDHDKNDEAVALAKKGFKKFPNNYNVGLSYAKALVSTGNYAKAIGVLGSLNILPFEHASESKKIYDQAHIYRAKKFMDKGQFSKATALLEASKKWPENLGVGTPFNPDTRMADYLLGLCHEKLQNADKAGGFFEQVAKYRRHSDSNVVRNSLFKLMSHGKLGNDAAREKLLSQIQKESEDNQTAAMLLALHVQDGEKIKDLNESLNWDNRFLDILKYVAKQQ
ncbi:DUF5107 domain-containing protein [Flagellimonas algicola]|uniref:DUF5107 domain-containing protein n=1 Tax=Flagellimonas algicola TaxID=2583815 RepID=A0ABY2WPX0_9FLAO|nr:DUF5107 domain-containing protein [Allomuricauda algicola]TMU57034.1 DUF5107 domain-containing protein [Allomuricauda algicola]